MIPRRLWGSEGDPLISADSHYYGSVLRLLRMNLLTKAQAPSRIPLTISMSVAGALLLEALGETQARILRVRASGIHLLSEKTRVPGETPPVKVGPRVAGGQGSPAHRRRIGKRIEKRGRDHPNMLKRTGVQTLTFHRVTNRLILTLLSRLVFTNTAGLFAHRPCPV